MAVRPNDPTVAIEGKIEHKSAKSYLMELTLGGRYFVPFSQILGGADGIGDPDGYGNFQIEVSQWWWDRKTEVEDTR